MKRGYLYRYFYQNAVHGFFFWLVLFVMIFEFSVPFLFQAGEINAKWLLDQINLNIYILGFILAPALGIVAGRILVKKESEILFVYPLSRKQFYFASFIFYGSFLVLLWLFFVLLYLLVCKTFDQPVTLELILRLILSLFGILLPFFWVGFFAVNTRPVVAVLLYLIIFFTVPQIPDTFAGPEKSLGEKILTSGAKIISLIVPKVQSFQMIASPFSQLNTRTTDIISLKWLFYGLVWSGFLLLSGWLLYERKDMVDPQS